MEILWKSIRVLNQTKQEIDDELGEYEENYEENDYKRKIREEKDFGNNLKLKSIYNNESLLK